MTGFGLVGHLSEMLGEFSCEISFKSLRLLPDLKSLFDGFKEDLVKGFNNLEYAVQRGFQCTFDSDFIKAVCCDPISSGGLLIAVKGADEAEKVAGVINGAVVGRVYKGVQKEIQFKDQFY